LKELGVEVPSLEILAENEFQKQKELLSQSEKRTLSQPSLKPKE
jgi:hypothetical protein